MACFAEENSQGVIRFMLKTTSKKRSVRVLINQQNKNIMIPFSIRSYTKKELSLMYFPDSIPNTAVKHLMGWIKRCPPLMGELQAMGYHTSNKTFTPRQVKAIVEQLGEP